MKTRKPKLASGERIVVDISNGGTPDLGSQSGVVSTGTQGEALPKRALRSIIAFGVLGMVMIFLTYVVLATTVFVIMRADGNNVAVLRNTFPIGQAPSGALVYASSAPTDQSFVGKAEQAVFGVPAGSVVQIVAGPAAAVSTNKDGYLVVNGKATEYQGMTDTQNIAHQYLAICVSGACKENAAVIVGEQNIIGEVKGYLTTAGITDPDVDLP